MQIPYRKPTQFSELKHDPVMTKAKFVELTQELEHLKAVRPPAAAEVARLAELGDFSENAEYQLAKGKLRGINNAILRLETHINQAEIIAPTTQGTIQVGSTVVVEVDGKQKTYQILGSSETSPEQGIISYHSPIGEALIGHRVGDTVPVKMGAKERIFSIISLS